MVKVEDLKTYLYSEIAHVETLERERRTLDERICADTNYYGGVLTGYKNVLWWLDNKVNK